MYIIIPIGTQGMGKSTLAKGLNIPSVSTHGHIDESSFFKEVYAASSSCSGARSLFIDRCNLKESNRIDILVSLNGDNTYDIIYVDFINDNPKDQLKDKAFRQARDRDQTGQTIKYNPKNGGLALRRVINIRLEKYESPMHDDVYKLLPMLKSIHIIDVDITANINDVVEDVLKKTSWDQVIAQQ
jgi:adenylate kinase family enzyme